MKQYKVQMIPGPDDAGGPSGIRTVIESYHRIAPKYGIHFVGSGADVSIVHAGMGGKRGRQSQADIAMLHGIYFTAEYDAHKWEYRYNQSVIENAMSALTVTVPSNWVADTLRKEFKIDPYILGHGVFWEEWQHDKAPDKNMVFWGKNRIFSDVCDPAGLVEIAEIMPDIKFITTLAPKDVPKNVTALGLLSPEDIKKVVQKAGVVLSTIKETWGLLYIEALAAGTPVVTANYGHVPNLVEHGVTGYHYRPDRIMDLKRGIHWCLDNRDVLSRNARMRAKNYSWDKVMVELRKVIEVTMAKKEKAGD